MRFPMLLAIARAEIRSTRRLIRYWIFAGLSVLLTVAIYLYYGFLHGFATLAPNTVVFYKVTDVYAPDCDGNVRFDDPALGLDWGIDPEVAVLSEKDQKAPLFEDWDSPF